MVLKGIKFPSGCLLKGPLKVWDNDVFGEWHSVAQSPGRMKAVLPGCERNPGVSKEIGFFILHCVIESKAGGGGMTDVSH